MDFFSSSQPQRDCCLSVLLGHMVAFHSSEVNWLWPWPTREHEFITALQWDWRVFKEHAIIHPWLWIIRHKWSSKIYDASYRRELWAAVNPSKSSKWLCEMEDHREKSLNVFICFPFVPATDILRHNIFFKIQLPFQFMAWTFITAYVNNAQNILTILLHVKLPQPV